MIQIDDTIISLDIFEKNFLCDLSSCKGACCVEGDSGAPLLPEEKEVLEKIFPKVKPYMNKKSVKIVEEIGVAIIDSDNDLTTPLVNNRECVYAIIEKGIYKCAIEKAFSNGDISFKKPISCHLYPIRIKKYKDFEAINYEKIKICQPACACGDALKIPVYVFLKEALRRKYGSNWYNKLEEAAKLI